MELNVRNLTNEAALKLRKLRDKLGYSRGEMASYLGVTRSGYNKNESGETFPGIQSLYRLSRDHDISLDWFFFSKGPSTFNEKTGSEELKRRVTELEAALEDARRREEELKKEAALEEERSRVEELKKEASTGPGTDNRDRDMASELKELIGHMEQIPLLYHEIMVHYHRFKLDNRRLVEVSVSGKNGKGDR